jgi:transposase
MSTVVAGVDPHLDTFTVAVCNANGRCIADETFGNDPDGFNQAARFAQRLGVGVWAVEGTGTYGRCLTDHITRTGGTVVEVPPRRTATTRRRVGGSKSDVIDATACARAHLETPLGVVTHNDEIEAIRVLVAWRQSLVDTQTQTICRIKARIRELDPPTAAHLRLESVRAWRRLIDYQPPIASPHADAIRDLVRYEAATAADRLTQIRLLERRIANQMPTQGQALIDRIYGIGPVSAAMILTHAGDITRFPTEAKFAMWAAAAPLDASSGRHQHHRHNRGGDRQMDHVLETAIRTQLAHHQPAADYIKHRRASGDTNRQAFRALKRHLARKIYRTLKQHTTTQPT